MSTFDSVEQATNGVKEVLDVAAASLAAARTVLATAGKSGGSLVSHSGQAFTEIVETLDRHMAELQAELEAGADKIVEGVGAAAAEVVPGGEGR